MFYKITFGIAHTLQPTHINQGSIAETAGWLLVADERAMCVVAWHMLDSNSDWMKCWWIGKKFFIENLCSKISWSEYQNVFSSCSYQMFQIIHTQKIAIRSNVFSRTKDIHCKVAKKECSKLISLPFFFNLPFAASETNIILWRVENLKI